MDASDVIRALPEHPCEEGAVQTWIKEGKGAIKWARLSCRTFVANAVRLQLHALTYNLGNFMRQRAFESHGLRGLRASGIQQYSEPRRP
jgi:hypothetical protein